MSPRAPAAPVPAATLLLVRDGASGLEVFMLERHPAVEFVPGALVFPGGKVQPSDADPALRPRYRGAGDLSDEGLALRAAAIREAFEECRILLARRQGEFALVAGDPLRELATRFRSALQSGASDLRALLEIGDLELAGDLLIPYAHWITPEIVSRRFDTHFFLASAPPDQAALHEGGESVDSLWISPADAIAEEQAGRRTIIFPTLLNLRKLTTESPRSRWTQ